MPRAYWKLPESRLASSFMVIEPSEIESARMIKIDDVDRLYGGSGTILPHRQFALTTSEFRATNHSAYFGNDYEQWDPDRAMREASTIRFADEPLPKPWVMWPNEALREMRPSCEGKKPSGKDSCRDREIWMEQYDSFRKRRKVSLSRLTQRESSDS